MTLTWRLSVRWKYLNKIAELFPVSREDTEPLVNVAIITLGSKTTDNCHMQMDETDMNAALSVVDLEKIKIEGKVCGKMEDTTLVKGVVVDKSVNHPQMSKILKDVKLAILTCLFELPKHKTAHKLDVTLAEDYKALLVCEQEQFTQLVDHMKATGAPFAICLWRFDDETKHQMLQKEMPAVHWMGGSEIELIAILIGAS